MNKFEVWRPADINIGITFNTYLTVLDINKEFVLEQKLQNRPIDL